jgi:hypothetical protein
MLIRCRTRPRARQPWQNAYGVPSYPTEFRWTAPESGNPVNILVDEKVVGVALYNGVALRGVWDAGRAQWTAHPSGFLRVKAAR